MGFLLFRSYFVQKFFECRDSTKFESSNLNYESYLKSIHMKAITITAIPDEHITKSILTASITLINFTSEITEIDLLLFLHNS